MPPEFPLPVPSPLAVSAQGLAEKIVSGGAIVTLMKDTVQRYLVGHFTWVDPHRIFWFTAHGDAAEDGHVLDFEELRLVPNQRISFYRAGKRIACLATIRAAGLEDPDDYHIAWQLWQEVAPRRAKLIVDCLERYSPPDEDEVVWAERPPRAIPARLPA